MDTFCTLCATAHAASRDDGVLFGDPAPAPARSEVSAAEGLIAIDVAKRIEEEWMGETPPARELL